MPDLHPHFTETLALLKLEDAGGLAWRELRFRYSDPGRHYHTLDHIAYCLHQLATTAHDTPTLRLALYYHDVIYDSCGEHNELQSARFATSQLTALGLQDCSKIYDLIRATDHHSGPPVLHSDLICDIDLAALGSHPLEYRRYAKAIRREYAWLPEGKYRRGRTKVLTHFLERLTIYQTPEFQRRLEDQARINMTNEIMLLRG